MQTQPLYTTNERLTNAMKKASCSPEQIELVIELIQPVVSYRRAKYKKQQSKC